MARVLIVDDDPTIRHLLDDVLRIDEGYETFHAADGQSAVEIARDEHPQVILMDLTLPVLSGEDAIRILKDDSRTRGIRIIAMSAGVNLRRHADELLADGLLGKPFDLDTLAANVALQMRHAVVPSIAGPDGIEEID
ncbi:response regulator [Nitrolancea hollandica]|uniref:response regulator n=1 Tax=Nitrolancea hollandica TaxID=1206749 RepID=UPI0002E75B94|nr:response regulator [Nitrolancea hollandica]